MAKNTLTLGPVEITTGPESPSRMALLLWGDAGCGKTTWAATAPGKKLWLSFGDQEHVVVRHRKDVMVADFSGMDFHDLFKFGQNDNPFGLDGILADNEEITTVVCDSITAIIFRALQKALYMKIGASREFTPTIEAPGISAYGARNAITLEVLTGLLRVTAKHGVHFIATAHEDDPKLKKEGRDEVIDYIGIMLGGKIVSNTTWRLSEIWYMSQNATGARNRRIAVRPTRLRRPMKSRMFSGLGNPEFELLYDPDKPDNAKGQMTIARFFEEWRDGNGVKLKVP